MLMVLAFLIASSLFHGFFPLQWAETLNSDNLFAVPMAVIVGVPLYSDEVGVIPLVEAMLLKDSFTRRKFGKTCTFHCC
jgi:uncharacterized membrane protein YraQ (UPF0718 family)